MNEPNKVITTWNRKHAYKDNSRFVDRLIISGFSTEQIITILQTVESVCHECWDSDSDCQCWNNE